MTYNQHTEFWIDSAGNTSFDRLGFQAAYHHRSAAIEANRILTTAGLSSSMLQHWDELGRHTVQLFAARRTIDIIGCESSDRASVMHTRLFRHITNTLGEKFSHRFIFGNAMMDREKNSLNVIDTLVFQVIGATTYFGGYGSAVSFFLGETLKRNIEVSAKKDPKTLLQEYFQKNKWRIPSYDNIGITGKQNNQVFHVQIKDQKGRVATGKGETKRNAEKDAAYNFLKSYHPETGLDNTKQVQFHPPISVRALSISELPNSLTAQKLCSELNLPTWSIGLMALSQTHRSYENLRAHTLGKDNRLLAFFGSYAIAWGIRDYCTRNVDADLIKNSGGLAQTSLFALSKEGLQAACSWIFEGRFQCVGRAMAGSGATGIHAMQAEMVQSLIGVLFLARENKIVNFSDVINEVPGVHDYFMTTASRVRPKEETLARKTSLQERLQAVGAQVRYSIASTTRDNLISSQPTIKILSPNVDRALTIYGSKSVSLKHESLTRIQYEELHAGNICKIFDETMGLLEISQPAALTHFPIREWLIEHCINFAKTTITNPTARKSAKFIEAHPLGVRFLQQNNLPKFMNWMRFIDGIHPLNLQGDEIIRFYAFAGNTLSESKLRKSLINSLKVLSHKLEGIDPLGSQNFHQSNHEFQSLVDFATWLRILAAPAARLCVSELAEQCEILFDKKINFARTNAEIFELKGSHLALLSLLLECHKLANISETHLTITLDAEQLFISSKANHQLIVKQLELRPLWSGLKSILGLRCDDSTVGQFNLSLSSLSGDHSSVYAMEAWWAYMSGGALNAAAGDVVATVLHDMKNELLAYFSASIQAKEANIKADKYRFAATASRHIEAALIQVGTVNLVIQNSFSAQRTKFDLISFLRRLTVDVISWMPIGINFNIAYQESTPMIYGDENLIRSLLTNIIRNSSEAIGKNSGLIELRYEFTEDKKLIKFQVEDNGPGFSQEQLAQLNRGQPIASSKRHGPGIGLLTVLLLAQTLGGVVSFQESVAGGSIVDFSIPFDEENDEREDINDKSSNQEVNVQ